MSYDVKIDWTCPHYIREEALFVGADRTTVRPTMPIISGSSVRVRLNGDLEVPMPGVVAPGKAISSKKEPFNIVAGANTLVVEVVGVGTYTTVFPPGQGWSAEQLVRRLASQTPGIEFKAVGGRIVIQTRATLGSRFRVLAAGTTIATVLGLPTGRFWSATSVAPSWTLIRDEQVIYPIPTQTLMFDEPLHGFRNFVELDYVTRQEYCRRCSGLGVEHDFRYDSRGEVITVRNEDLLLQEVQKTTFTIRGSNPFVLWYGSLLTTMIGQKISEAGINPQFIENDLRETFRRWQQVKRLQETVQTVSDEEYPFNVSQLTVTQSTVDPTVILVNAVIQNRSNRVITLDRGIRLPSDGTTDGTIRQSIDNFVSVT